MPPPQVLGVLGLVSSAIITFGLALVVQVSPWYDPQASKQPACSARLAGLISVIMFSSARMPCALFCLLH